MGFRESDENFPVVITDLNNKKVQMTLGEIADYAELKKSYLKDFDMLEGKGKVRSVRNDFWTMDLNEEVRKFHENFLKHSNKIIRG